MKIISRDERIVDHIAPERCIASEGCSAPELLLHSEASQPSTAKREDCTISPGGWILLDFGEEIHGGIRLVTGSFPGIPFDAAEDKGIRLHVTFGESVSETFSLPDYCHAPQNMEMKIVPLAAVSCGELGFRFVRIRNIDRKPAPLQSVTARYIHRDLPLKAEFFCSDDMLNRIWQTSAKTLLLCLQNYAWDGIKRDRLVWMGDLYPELKACAALFGKQDVIEKSMDFVRDETPLPRYMNGIWVYSIWWILGQFHWFRRFGDSDYLRSQKEYLTALLRVFAGNMDENGLQKGWDAALLDWASNETESLPGAHALLLLAFRAGEKLCRILDDPETAEICAAASRKMSRLDFPVTDSMAGNAFQVFAGWKDAEKMYNDVFSKTLPRRMSTFLGCFTLDACVKGKHSREALDHLRAYWGGMIELGATSFWEHFEIDWLDNGARIDELVPPGKTDIHKERGSGCFKGFRNSLCHGWASLPGEWLLRNVLGVSFLDPSNIRFAPDLCGLKFAEGKIRTEYGTISVKLGNGRPEILLPDGIRIAEGK